MKNASERNYWEIDKAIENRTTENIERHNQAASTTETAEAGNVQQPLPSAVESQEHRWFRRIAGLSRHDRDRDGQERALSVDTG